ncbi:MiaB/RimO family radical SAM methylthiotransferase [Desulfobacterium sp. N47]|uniref:tRNA-2-methylthio-N(6)-dimethylallyladenosine synthase n=1 Tax=uncultured Desulfobacterium sp. TaxID=201089 RepID=E1YDK8_9BACT|nr:(Dimethylallyl)adenosine tRNA methylthiotransferase miaB [uncultured Desulfobacterium sp.]
MKKKSLYINTFGCQMNVYDSQQIISQLNPIGYEVSESLDEADLIIVNTCAIREKAQQKAFSFFGRLAVLKRKKPGLIICAGGCVAQQEGKRILERFSYIDLVFGTHALKRLPEHIINISKKRCRISDVEMTDEILEFPSVASQVTNNIVTRFVTIMRGCDNYCTYCVVPHVRGPEISRKPEHIIDEIRKLVDSGVQEVTLLGQNVNSYGIKEGLCSFPELLRLVSETEGLFRIRFTTSHPKDLSQELVFAFRDLDKLCNHIHLPVQSGSNNILKRMNRKYTRELYLEKIDKLRKISPDIAITSDVIVGFPGETEDDFKATLDLVKEVEFDSLFTFEYSDRIKAPAAKFSDKISDDIKNGRLRELLELQEYYTTKKHRALVGSNELILVDGFSKKQDVASDRKGSEGIYWSGRTSTNKIVNFTSGDFFLKDDISIGKKINVKIEKAFLHSLLGKPVNLIPKPSKKKEETHAA